MNIIDKNNLLPQLDEISEIHIEIGCGDRKHNPQAIGIDLIDYDCVDLVGDVFEILELFPDGSVSSVRAVHFLEHLEDPVLLMHVIQRISKINAVIEVVVPHFSNPHYYSDITHKSEFGLYTFCYLCSGSIFKRQVPVYGDETGFQIMDVSLVFKSSPPFYVRHLIKKSFGFIFNLNTYMKEFYEENLCYLFPCYEIRFRLRKC